MVPLPSLSMSAIIFLTSSFLGSKPSARMATLSSCGSSKWVQGRRLGRQAAKECGLVPD